MAILEKTGLIGWQKIEPVIISAIHSGKAVLMIGNSGTSKSDGAHRISKAFQGDKCVHKNYEVQSLDPSDLLGPFNSESFKKGKVDFINTPLSIWGATSVLLDEINCANLFVQAKLHELVRVQEIMGLETDVELVWAAINPPAKFQTPYMSVPLTSRFVEVETPSTKEMPNEDLISIMTSNLIEKKSIPFFGNQLQEAGQVILSKKEVKNIQSIVVELNKAVNETQGILSFEGRSLKVTYQMLCSFLACRKIFKDMYFDDTSLNLIVKSLIPEMNLAVRNNNKIDTVSLDLRLAEILSNFYMADELRGVDNISDLLKMKIEDELNWLNVAKTLIGKENSVSELKKIKKLVVSATIPVHVQSHLTNIIKVKYFDNALKNGIVNLSYLSSIKD